MLARLSILAVIITLALNPAAYGQPGPTTAEELVDRGIESLEEEEYDKAIRDFDEAIRLDPRCVSAYRGRGSSQMFRISFDKALAGFEMVLQLDADDIFSLNRRGIIRMMKGQHDRAI